MSAVLAENLSKIYTGGNKAANNISFRLEQGEIFGFLGPNGAGKTTTIKMLCGMLTPSSGSCRMVNGAACSYHCAAVYHGVCYGTGSGVSLSCGPFFE